MSIPLNALLLEDRATDAELVAYELKRAGFDLNWRRVDNEADFLTSLNPTLDVILSDYALPSWDGSRALRALQEVGLDIPFIIISGTIGEDIAVECIKQGAADYLLKDRIGRLGTAVLKALEDKRQRLEKQQILLELNRLKEFHQNIVQSIAEGIIILSPELKITFANTAAATSLGYTPQELLGLDLINSQLLLPSDRRLFSEIPGAELSNEIRQCELEVVLRDGTQRSLLINASSQFEEGRFTGTLISFTDITERKKAENERRKLYTAVEQSNSSVIMTDLQGKIEYVNRQFTLVTGYTAEEVIGKNTRILKSGETSPQTYKQLWDTISAGGVWHGEFHNRKKNGELFWELASISPVKNLNGQVTSFLAVKENITERKWAEEALHNSEQQYRQLIESLHSGVVVHAPDTSIILYNEKASELLGLSHDQMLGKRAHDPVWNFTRKDGSPLPLEEYPVNRALVSPKPIVNLEIGIKKPNTANVSWVLVNAFQEFNDQREIKHVVVTFLDITDRRRAEEALRQSEARYRQAFELHGLPEIIIDPATGAIVEANPAASKYYGYPPETFNTMKITDITLAPPEKVIETLEQALAREVTSSTFLQRLASGEVREFEVFTGPLEIEGRPLLHSIFVDITARKQAEAALQEVNGTLEVKVLERTAELERVKNRLEAIFNHSGEGILLLDLEKGLQQTNYAFDKLFRSTTETTLGHSLLDFVDPTYVERLEDVIQKVVQTHKAQQIELLAQPHNETSFEAEINISPVNYSDKAVTSLVCIVRDVSERKRNQQLIAEERNLLRTVIDTVPDYIYVKDTQHRIVLNNVAHARPLPTQTPEQTIGKTDFELFPAEMAAKFWADDAELFRSGQPLLNTEERSLGQAGNSIWTSTTKVPLKNLNEELIGLVGITHDITKQKLYEETLEKALQQEKEVSELKTRFVSVASHEFRTPLSTILAATENLLAYREKMDGSQIDKRLDKIRGQVGHLKLIMDDVLTLSRIQAGHLEFNPVETDLNAFCRDIIEEFESDPHIQHRILYSCIPQPLKTRIDLKLMRQILNNLLSNALKYSPEGKSVNFEVSVQGKAFRIQVKDEGIGIPKEDLKHLFEPFHRAANVGTISGTGLGLAIAKQSVETHGGTIEVESEIGVGTNFTVTIPLPGLGLLPILGENAH